MTRTFSSAFSAAHTGLFMIVAGVSVAAFAITASAQQAQSSQAQNPKAPSKAANEWFDGEWTVGAVGGVSTSPYKGTDKTDVGALPMVAFDSKRLHAGIDGIFVNPIVTDSWTVSVGAAPRFAPFDPKDSSYLNGMKKRKFGVDMGGKVEYSTGFGDIGLSYLADVSGQSKGHQVGLTYGYGIGGERWHLGTEAGITWESSKLVAWNAGVSASEARADRKQYSPDAAWIPHIGINGAYNVWKGLWLNAGAEVQFLPSEYTDSPIIDDKTVYSLTTGVVYKF